MSADTRFLAEIPLFQLMDDHERFALSGLLEPITLPQGRVLFREGDPADSLFILRSGKLRGFVRTDLGDDLEVGEVHPGEVVGEISLFDGGPRTASVEALEDSALLEVDRDALLALIERHPHVGIDLLSVVGARLRTSGVLLRSLATRNLNVAVEERLTLGQRCADRLAAFGGSWWFLLLFTSLILAWMTHNSFWKQTAFDPYPFILLNLVLSTLAAIQAPIIMMSQNRQAHKDRVQADLDFRINLKAELEVAELHRKIDRLYDILQRQAGGTPHARGSENTPKK